VTAPSDDLREAAAPSDDLREAAATFGDAQPVDEWEARRRELAAFYAVRKRQPRRRALNAAERRIAAWAARQAKRHGTSNWERKLVLLQLTPGWAAASSCRHHPRVRRATFVPSL
jgi:hypothetical protein